MAPLGRWRAESKAVDGEHYLYTISYINLVLQDYSSIHSNLGMWKFRCSRSMSFYRSKPLAGRNIRLVNLLPGQFDDDITCTLSIADLENAPKYEALSYVWGDPIITHDIKIGRPYFSRNNQPRVCPEAFSTSFLKYYGKICVGRCHLHWSTQWSWEDKPDPFDGRHLSEILSSARLARRYH